MSAGFLLVVIEHLLAETLWEIRLFVDNNAEKSQNSGSNIEQHKALVRLLLKSAIEPHHPADE